MEKYVFKEYDPRYPKFFSLEKGKLEKVLGSSAVIEHVGSTAIPGLGGKGILDILIGATNLESSKIELENAGYEFRKNASATNRLFFRKDYARDDDIRRVHLHLTTFQGKDWTEIITFRDYLLKHPDAVRKYAKLKHEAVELASGNGVTYRKHKERFIRKVIDDTKKL